MIHLFVFLLPYLFITSVLVCSVMLIFQFGGPGAFSYIVMNVLPYLMIATVSGLIHRRVQTKLSKWFAAHFNGAWITTIFVSLFAALCFVSFGGGVGIFAKIIAIGISAVAGAICIETFGKMYSALVYRIMKTDNFGETMKSKIVDIFKDDKDPLKRGDLYAYAISKWDPKKDHHLFAKIHKDVVQPVHKDGVTVTGDPHYIQSYGLLSDDVIPQMFEGRKFHSTNFAQITFCFIAAALIIIFGLSYQNGTQKVANQIDGITATAKTSNSFELTKDVWNVNERKAAILEEKSAAESAATRMTTVAKIMVFPTAFMTTFVSAVLMASISMLWLLLQLMSPRGIKKAINYVVNKDIARTLEYKSRARHNVTAARKESELDSYISQIERTNRDKSPLVYFGKALGTTTLHGCISGYMYDQSVCLSLNDYLTSVLFVGKPDSGKTFSGLKPVLRQMLQMKTDFDYAMLIMDYKGSLQKDAIEICRKLNRPVSVIGPGLNDFGVDLLRGLDPAVATAMLREMYAVEGSGQGGKLWIEGGLTMFLHSAVITRAYECTPEFKQELYETGESAYGFLGIKKLGAAAKIYRTTGDGRVSREIGAILATMENDPTAISCFTDSILITAIEYFQIDVPAMDIAQFQSFEINFQMLLNGFETHEGIRSNFAAVSGERMMNIQDIFLGRAVTTISLSQLHGGEAARIASLFVKMLVLREARLRMDANPTINEVSRLHIMMDECQHLITVGPDGESSFLGVGRQTGVNFTFACPGLSYLSMALGEEPLGGKTCAFLDSIGSKFFLATHGGGTDHKYIDEKMGTALRSTNGDYDTYESYYDYQREVMKIKSMDDNVFPYSFTQKQVNSFPLTNMQGDIEVVRRSNFRLETEFYSSTLKGKDQQVDWIEKQKAMVHHRDAKDKAFHGEGHSMMAIIPAEMPSEFGQGKCLAMLTRGGHMKKDVLKLDPYTAMSEEEKCKALGIPYEFELEIASA